MGIASVAVTVFQNGQSLLLASKRLDHASISTTGDVDGHLLPGWQKDAANAFAKAMEEGYLKSKSAVARPE